MENLQERIFGRNLKLRHPLVIAAMLTLYLHSLLALMYVGNEPSFNYHFARIQNLNNPDLRWGGNQKQFNIVIFGFQKMCYLVPIDLV
jgi:hypothetical protein